MHRYHALRREGRIEFVTFHQSFTYEDFVEGLRPETEPSDAEASAGFRLKPQQGVFRKIAALAEQANRAASTPPHRARRLDLSGRQFWKMGLGAIGTEDHVYEDAIEGGYIVLGWGGSVNWSDPVYDDIGAVRKKWAELGSGDSRPSNVTQLWPFRSEMKKGDIVIVPYGNSAFRAIGEVTGEYTFVPTDNSNYNHRRSVNWLLVLDKELPLDTIVDGAFTMRTLYRLEPRRVRMEAISSLINGAPDVSPGEPATPKPYVLVIDEVNRANISKVFGELITLIEQNKRLGMPDEITVRLPYSGEEFGVPANLHVIGTMNTADRSIALLDTALRRRFTFREMMPKPELLADASRRTDVPLVDVLRTMNERIEYLFDREHQIGHAFFIDCNSRDDVDAVMRYRIIPLLQEYFFEDWSRLAQVLNEKKQVGDGAFLRCERVRVPPGVDGEDRWRWSIREMFAENAYEHLLATAATE
jgi:5-methylcytosine-specific restriction protein B